MSTRHPGCPSFGRSAGVTDDEGRAFCIDCNSYFTPTTEQMGTHWEGCWRVHHECAVSLLDKILREETIGHDQARRLLAEAKAALAGRCEVHNGSPCADCGAVRADGLLVAPLYPYGGAFGYGPPAPRNGLGQGSDVNGPDGAWCDYCTPRRLYHSTDHPGSEEGS